MVSSSILFILHLFLFSMRPNIVVGVEDGESMYTKWYFEVVIDHIEQVTHARPHIRIGWATTQFQPSPGHGDGFSANGIGDNTYSYGFDGQNVWFAGRAYDVVNEDRIYSGFQKNDVVGCLLDLSIPEMWFSLNGLPVTGLLREFNLTGMFYPAVSISSRVRYEELKGMFSEIYFYLVVDLFSVVNMVDLIIDHLKVLLHSMKQCY